MSWIALKMLVGDRAKFLGIVMGLTFAALLITQQGSIFCGLMCRTAGQIFDLRNAGADLWVMDPNVRYVDDVKPMIENNLYRVRSVEGVEWAVPLYKGNARAKITSYEQDAAGNPVFQEVRPRVSATIGGATGGREPSLTQQLLAPAGTPPRTFVLAAGPDADAERGAGGSPILVERPGSGAVAAEGPPRRYRLVLGSSGAPVSGGAERLWISPEDDPESKIAIQPIRHEVIEQVILLGVDDASLVGAPPFHPEDPERNRVLAGDLTDLRKPDAVFVDFTRLRKLYPGEPWHLLPEPVRWASLRDEADKLGRRLGLISPSTPHWRQVDLAQRRRFYQRFLGREIEMNDRRAVIVGVCEATRTFQSNAVVYTTFSRAKQFVPRERKMLSYILAKTETATNPETGRPKKIDPRTVALAIRSQTGLKARTSTEFISDTIWYFMKFTGIPINFGITAALGFLVGTAIAGQTFYNFTLDNIKQFGALKAMGTTNRRIVGMILLQAVVVGLLGYGIGVGLATVFGEQSKGGELAFYTPWELLPITAVAIVCICVLSSILSVRRVIVLEPAIVFRG